MQFRTLFFAVAAGASALALAACGGGGSTIITPTPGPTCLPNTIQSALVFPAPGSTAVPDTIAQIVVAVSSPLPNNTFNLELQGPSFTNGSVQTGNDLVQIAASQLPPGSQVPTFANPTYEQVQLQSAFQPATQVTGVGINDPLSACTPLAIPGAAFTTQ